MDDTSGGCYGRVWLVPVPGTIPYYSFIQVLALVWYQVLVVPVSTIGSFIVTIIIQNTTPLLFLDDYCDPQLRIRYMTHPF